MTGSIEWRLVFGAWASLQASPLTPKAIKALKRLGWRQGPTVGLYHNDDQLSACAHAVIMELDRDSAKMVVDILRATHPHMARAAERAYDVAWGEVN